MCAEHGTNLIPDRDLHITGLLNDKKVDIESVLLEKGKDFAIKTAVHIRRMFEKFGYDEVFGRSAVIELLGLKIRVRQNFFQI